MATDYSQFIPLLAQAMLDLQKLGDIVHGDASATVETDAGTVDSLAKAIAAITAQAGPIHDDFTGDGVETDWTLSTTPKSAAALMVFVNGVPIRDFTLDGATLTIDPAVTDTHKIETIDFSSTGAIDAADLKAVADIASHMAAVAGVAGDIPAVAGVAGDIEALVQGPAIGAFMAEHPDVQPPALAIDARIPGAAGLLACTRSGTAATTVDARRRIVQAAENATRLWHDPSSGRRQMILKEAAATNLCLRSGDLSVSPWIDSGTPSTGAGATAPDGSASTRITDSQTGASSSRRQLIDLSGFSAGDVITVSAWIRRSDLGVYPALRAFIFDDDSPANELFDAALLPFSATKSVDLTGGWDDYGFETWPDGWVRCWGRIVLPDPGAHALDYLDIRGFPAWSDQDGTGAFSTAQGFADFFGYQVEEGYGPSSYIPTAASQITRPADELSRAIAGHVAEKSATFAVAYRALRSDIANTILMAIVSFGDETMSNGDDWIMFRQRNPNDATPGLPNVSVDAQGSVSTPGSLSVDQGLNNTVRAALAMDQDGATYEANGAGELDTAAPGFPDQSVMTHLVIGKASSVSTHHNVGIEQIYIWPAKLSNADLSEVTG